MNKVLLGDVAEEVRDNYKETDGNPAVVGLEHLIPGEIRLKEWSEDTNTTFTKAFHKGQVLFGRRRAYLKKAAVAPVDGICSGDITVISAKPDKILPELLPFVIQNDDFFDFAVGKSAGSLSPRVKWSRLKEYEFNLPSLPQQKELAKLLWSFVDAKEAYEDLIRQTDELVKSQFIEMFKDTQRVPLSEVAEIVMGQSPKGDTYNTNGEGILFNQGSGDFTDKYVATKMYCTAPTRIAKAGDVLMSVRAPVGTVNITLDDCCIGRGLAAIRSRKSKEYNEYFFQAFKVMENEIANMGQGSTVNSISKDMLLGIMMPDASIVQQGWFVKFARQSDKSKFELQYVNRNVKEMITCSQKKIRLNR